MAVIFKTFDQIEIDGINAGSIVDVISNHGPRRAEVLAAFGVYSAGLRVVLDAEKTQLGEGHTVALNAANATIAAQTATIATLQTEVAELSPFRPFNKRHLKNTDVLLARLTQKETKAFYSSTDPLIVGGQELFDEYETEEYYVDLDDPRVQQLTGYMVQLGMLESMERRAIVLRDATAEEAYYPTV